MPSPPSIPAWRGGHTASSGPMDESRQPGTCRGRRRLARLSLVSGVGPTESQTALPCDQRQPTGLGRGPRWPQTSTQGLPASQTRDPKRGARQDLCSAASTSLPFSAHAWSTTMAPPTPSVPPPSGRRRPRPVRCATEPGHGQGPRSQPCVRRAGTVRGPACAALAASCPWRPPPPGSWLRPRGTGTRKRYAGLSARG